MERIYRYEKELVGELAVKLGMTFEELTARCRKRDIVECRQVTAWYLKDRYGWSSGKTGLLLGIDRTTVIYSVDKILG